MLLEIKTNYVSHQATLLLFHEYDAFMLEKQKILAKIHEKDTFQNRESV